MSVPVAHLGLDLGGTKLEAVALSPGFEAAEDPRGYVRARARTPTRAEEGYAAILDRAASLLKQVEAQAGAAAGSVSVGVGLPGHVSRLTGGVKNANTTCLNGRPVRRDLEARLGMPVALANDANLFALAEATWGGGRGAACVFGIILGTGVGGGLILGGQLWPGPQGIAGEWGHNPLEAGRPCYCGRDGCVETWLSGPGLARSLAEAGRPMSARDFDAAWRRGEVEGDEALAAVAEGYLQRFGRALGAVVNVLDPEVVILGGGMGRWPALLERGPAALAPHVFNDELLTRLAAPTLGDAAGVFGAALIGARAHRG